MDKENRKHPRFCPKGLSAKISISPPPPQDKITLEGTIIDMSYTGIKIKLNSPFNESLQKSIILINLTLPESGVPITIHGTIKHLCNVSEYGLQYANTHTESDIDDLMFECIKITDNQVQDNLQFL